MITVSINHIINMKVSTFIEKIEYIVSIRTSYQLDTA